MKDSKYFKHRACVESWKERNRDYYLFQKRMLSSRPEYLAKRRDDYARSKLDKKDLSSNKIDGSEADQNILRSNNCTGDRTKSPQIGHRFICSTGETEEGPN